MDWSSDIYIPAPGGAWEGRPPPDLGFDTSVLAGALDLVRSLKTTWDAPIAEIYARGEFDAPPWNIALGPVREPGPANGMIVKDGYIAAEWGDTTAVDMASSVTKIFLNACVGLALRDGLLSEPDQPVCASVAGPYFETKQNQSISWQHLLHLTSEWEGELWGVPDQVDRNRFVLPSGAGRPKPGENSHLTEPLTQRYTPGQKRVYKAKQALKKVLGLPLPRDRKGGPRPLRKPGKFWEYNDVRVNALSLALMHLWRRPLPDVLGPKLFNQIGVTDSWEWTGYDGALEVIGEKAVQSVAGGSHWGGGMFISTHDLARFGLLYACSGKWRGEQILPSSYVEGSFRAEGLAQNFGRLWWLNKGQSIYPTLPASGVLAYGAGSQLLWLDPPNDLVVVARWCHGPSIGYFLDRVYKALPGAKF